jgi:secreted PhoX family phosphatase
MDRRIFLRLLGITASVSLTGLPAWATGEDDPQLPFRPLAPGNQDILEVVTGMEWQRLIMWEEVINKSGETFGFNNDYLAFLPLDETEEDGLLWVNHEYADPLMISSRAHKSIPTKEQALMESYAVGGSIIRIKLGESGKWEMTQEGDYNRRISGRTPIPFSGKVPIAGSFEAVGMVGNCAGGITPWGTILTCEENYDACYGEHSRQPDGSYRYKPSSLGWHLHFPYPPEHYGWVTEVEVRTGKARKLVSLGRVAHECATYAKAKNGKAVIYSGEDANNECLYKFISDSNDSLVNGQLYVANLALGEWIPVSHSKQEALKDNFIDQTEVLIRLRDAAKLIGGTPLDRPEDIEIHPENGDVLIALTNNKPKGNHYGSILKIKEENADPGALKFTHETYMMGGKETGFACPDNLAFDPAGNLWFTSDMSGMGAEPYTDFGNNSLFVVPVKGPAAGSVIRIANAPKDAEFTGPFFHPSGKYLFLSVQHPGENSPSREQLTSTWPLGGGQIPRPSVVVLSGPVLEYFTLS